MSSWRLFCAHGLGLAHLWIQGVAGNLEPIPGSIGHRQDTPWTGCQFITGFNHIHIHTPIHTLWTLWTCRSAYHACLWTGGGNRSTRRKPRSMGRTCKLRTYRAAAGIKFPTLGMRHGTFREIHGSDALQAKEVLRSKIALETSQALYLLISGKNICSMTASMGEVYSQHRDPDGFLYMTYASQDMFG
ncbi:uncharacterized protein map1lc3cl isoform X2 [Ictalurus furcatus]|uniref:uncharacterized protein map1lc3cl isoform X2 n=1 Tax=Ictalurus furcatus TaxID=66913 RepID=UPI002350D141|nr:uncharacterized protein map1lc3cl isoform X2 [Ictalurus furcatus]